MTVGFYKAATSMAGNLNLVNYWSSSLELAFLNYCMALTIKSVFVMILDKIYVLLKISPDESMFSIATFCGAPFSSLKSTPDWHYYSLLTKTDD